MVECLASMEDVAFVQSSVLPIMFRSKSIEHRFIKYFKLALIVDITISYISCVALHTSRQ